MKVIYQCGTCGEVFPHREDAQKHELECSGIFHNIHAYDSCFQRIPATALYECLEDMDYFWCNTVEAIELLHEWAEERHMTFPLRGDVQINECWIWGADCEWHKMNKKEEEFFRDVSEILY